ncbi:MAG: hypothetical protein ABSA97_00715 [Verrucomicrobiia bacterium]|jgi:hypothetical protein
MKAEEPAAPRRIVVRLGEDFNWWLDQTSEGFQSGGERRGVLDPRQISHLLETLDEYRPYGLREQQFADAFQLFTFESEIAESCLRLAPTDDSIFSATAEMFAFPLIEEEGQGPYCDFLDALSAARIRRLNATHHYVQECTELEMHEELNALDTDRYFSSETIHVFDEINEILQWSPAEWDDSTAS